ncbi:MAG: ABC transporter substrate-binding protein [Bradyrhizobium sp.]|nr:ABC transporter substrate-binding protein [Bradyrhizobium sp.]
MRRRELLAFLGNAVIAWPVVAHAQSRVYRLGLLTLDAGEDVSQLVGRLRDLGYVEGKNLQHEHRSAEGDPKRLAALADELVQLKPDVLVAGWGTLAPKALRAVTETIPIVFSTVGDPIGAGLVQTLSRPGGNATGLSGQSNELKGKQLQLMLMCVPGQHIVGVLLNPDTPYSALALKQLKAAAEGQGIQLKVLEVRSPAELTAAGLDALAASGATSLFVIEDPLMAGLRTTVIGEATRLRLPTMTGLLEYARSGGLMAYGTGRKDQYRRTAEYVDKIFKGASPSELPVEQPTQFHFVINVKAAKAMDVAIPPSLLAVANEVIE